MKKRPGDNKNIGNKFIYEDANNRERSKPKLSGDVYRELISKRTPMWKKIKLFLIEWFRSAKKDFREECYFFFTKNIDPRVRHNYNMIICLTSFSITQCILIFIFYFIVFEQREIFILVIYTIYLFVAEFCFFYWWRDPEWGPRRTLWVFIQPLYTHCSDIDGFIEPGFDGFVDECRMRKKYYFNKIKRVYFFFKRNFFFIFRLLVNFYYFYLFYYHIFVYKYVYKRIFIRFFKFIFKFYRRYLRFIFSFFFNLFGYSEELILLILVKKVKDYWSIKGFTYYLFNGIFYLFLYLFLFIKRIIFFFVIDVISVGLTPSEVSIHKYGFLNSFLRFKKVKSIREMGKFNDEDPSLMSKTFYDLYNSNFTSNDTVNIIFRNLKFGSIKRMFNRYSSFMYIKMPFFPFKYNTFSFINLYRFYTNYVFSKVDNDFKQTRDYYLHLYNSIFNHYKFNSTAWYNDYWNKKRVVFFKFQAFKDVLFLYTTYKALGKEDQDLTTHNVDHLMVRDEFEKSKNSSNTVKTNFEIAYRHFLPRQVMYMNDLDYLFPDVGSYNKISIVRELFFQSFYKEISSIRYSPRLFHRKVFHRYLRFRWLNLFNMQRECQNDVRDYYQYIELQCLYNFHLNYINKKIFLNANKEKNFFYRKFNFLSSKIDGIINFSNYIVPSIFFNKFNIEYDHLNFNIKLLNFFTRKQLLMDISKRINIYEFSLKREAAAIQKSLAKPIFDLVTFEDQIYATYYKMYVYYANNLNEISWCKNYYEDFIDNDSLLSREKLRNSILSILSCYLTSYPFGFYMFNFQEDGGDPVEFDRIYLPILFGKKCKSYGLLINFGIKDFFVLLYHFIKGFYIFFDLFWNNKSNIAYLHFCDVFFHDLYLFIFFLPRYFFNIILYYVSKIKFLFWLFIKIYEVYYFGIYGVLVENKVDNFLGFLIFITLSIDEPELIELTYIPREREDFCRYYNLGYDDYVLLVSMPMMCLWFISVIYCYMSYWYVTIFPTIQYERDEDIYQFDEHERFVEGLMRIKLMSGDVTEYTREEKYETYELSRELRQTYLESDRFGVDGTETINETYAMGDPDLFNPEVYCLDSRWDMEAMYEAVKKGELELTEDELKFYEEEEAFDDMFEDVWSMVSNLDEDEAYRKDYTLYFYDNPRYLSYVVQERFSFIHSQKNSNLFSDKNSIEDVNLEFQNYIEYLTLVKQDSYIEVLYYDKLQAEQSSYNNTEKHESTFF